MDSRQEKCFGSIYRQKFIIPPLQKNNFPSEHHQTNNINSASLKRNLLFTSTKQKSLSHQKIKSISQEKQASHFFLKEQKRNAQKFKKQKQNLQKLNGKRLQQQPKINGINKFKVIHQVDQNAFNWQKWNKGNINLTGKGFLSALNKKISKQVQFQQGEKQNQQLFRLRHKIRELDKLKQSINSTKQNNQLIRNLQHQGSIKIQQFFNKYQKIIEKVII